MSILYTQALDEDAKKVYLKLENFSDKFVLAGGTALMFQINHRKSFDFDCFSDKPLSRSLLRKAREIFGDGISVKIDNSNVLLLTTPEGVKVDFVYHPYLPLHKIFVSKPISLFNVLDIASNKAFTIGRRATWRDYVDMFFILKWDLAKLETVIKETKERFNGEFNEKLFLQQLVYFQDLKITPTEFLKTPYSIEQIKNTLKNEVGKYTKRILD